MAGEFFAYVTPPMLGVPDHAAIKRGRLFEREVNEVLGLTDTPNSGAGWVDKSDGSGRLRVSSKSTSKRSWTETRRQLDEAVEMAHGTGEIPALAVEDEDGERFLILRLTDAASLMVDAVPFERQPRRAEVVRDTSHVPVLLRDD